ncbi:hypothetical protein [Brevibacterium salitolerans]|uniref:hypothetical protein n=1 Tax=Brevibacterium salitolerans TaxID=1403566 RepID=UPI0031D72DF5
MTLLGLLLLGIGSTDAVRASGTRRRRLASAAVWLAVLLAAGLLHAAPWWLLPVPLVAGLAWSAGVQVGEGPPSDRRSPRPRALLLVSAALLAATATVTAETLSAGDLAGRVHLGDLGGDTLVLAAGLTAFLVVSSNALVRGALRRDARPGAEERLRTASQLKGGRWIGPLERIALAGLLVAGAFPVAAGVIAAKGIVRFPEIQQDSGGTKAEQFLVGSLVSWVLALAAAGLLRLSMQ